jgi:CarboxypepD_reg-like domain
MRWIVHKYFLLGCFLSFAVVSRLSAQTYITGYVRNKVSMQPLAGVSISNSNLRFVTVTNEKGYFAIHAAPGNMIIFTSIGFEPDTLVVKTTGVPVLVYLQPVNILLRSVTINAKNNPYKQDSINRYELFAPELGQQKQKIVHSFFKHPLKNLENMISPGDKGPENISIPLLGVNLDGIYDHLSKKRKRTWEFQKMFQENEEQEYIQSRCPPDEITRLTGLQGDSLKDFLSEHFHPDYNFVRNATEYDLYSCLIDSVAAYREIVRNN